MKRIIPLVFLSLLVLTGCSSQSTASASPQAYRIAEPESVGATVFGTVVSVDKEKGAVILDKGDGEEQIICIGNIDTDLEIGQFVSLQGRLLQKDLLLVERENENDLVRA